MFTQTRPRTFAAASMRTHFDLAPPAPLLASPAVLDLEALSDVSVSSLGTSEMDEYDLMLDAHFTSGELQQSSHLAMDLESPDWHQPVATASPSGTQLAGDPSYSTREGQVQQGAAAPLADHLAFPPHDAGCFTSQPAPQDQEGRGDGGLAPSRTWSLGRTASVAAPASLSTPASASTLSPRSVWPDRACAAIHVLTADAGVAELMWSVVRAVEASLTHGRASADAGVDMIVEPTWGPTLRPGSAQVVLVPLPVEAGEVESALAECAGEEAGAGAGAGTGTGVGFTTVRPLLVPIKVSRTEGSLATLTSGSTSNRADQSLRDLVDFGRAAPEIVHWTEVVQRCGLRRTTHAHASTTGVQLLDPLGPRLERVVRLRDFAREIALAHAGRPDWACLYVHNVRTHNQLKRPAPLLAQPVPPQEPPAEHSDIGPGLQHSNATLTAGVEASTVRRGAVLLLVVLLLVQVRYYAWLAAASALERAHRSAHNGASPAPSQWPSPVPPVLELPLLPAPGPSALDTWVNDTMGPLALPVEHLRHTPSDDLDDYTYTEMQTASWGWNDTRTMSAAACPSSLGVPGCCADSALHTKPIHTDCRPAAGQPTLVPPGGASRPRFGTRPSREQVQAQLRSTRWRWKSRMRRAWPWPKRGDSVFAPHKRGKSPPWARPTAQEMRARLRA